MKCKRNLSLLTAGALLCMMPFPPMTVRAESGMCGGDIKWSYADGVLTLDGSGEMADYSATYRYNKETQKLDVISDTPWADWREEITELQFSDGITAIGAYAFYEMPNLRTVQLPDTLVSVGDYAFYQTEMLQKVQFPEALESIGEWAFCNSGLTELEIPQNVRILGDYSLSGNPFASLVIPENVQRLGFRCFSMCKELETVVLPDTDIRIGEGCFYACSSLTDIHLPNQLTALPAELFEFCTQLSAIEIPDTVTAIGDDCFNMCSSLTEIHLPASLRRIEKSVFAGTGLKELKLPEGLVSLGRDCFSFNRMNYLSLPSTLETLVSGALADCTIETIEFPAETEMVVEADALPEEWVRGQRGYVVVGNGYLYRYRGANTETMTLPEHVKTVMTDAIVNHKMVSLTLNEGAETVQKRAVVSETLESVTIPPSVMSIASGAFDDCPNLTTVRGEYYTAAQTFAMANGYTFEPLGEDVTDSPVYPDYETECFAFGNISELFGGGYHMTPWMEAVLLDYAQPTDSLAENLASSWGGSCYGFSALTVMVKAGVLPLSALDPNAGTLHEVQPTEHVLSMVNYYQMTQNLMAVADAERYHDLTQFQRLRRAVRCAEDVNRGGNPFVLTITTKTGAHALVGYGLEAGEWEWDGVTYNRRILIWDSNYLGQSERSFVYFDRDLLYWTIPAYDIRFLSDTATDIGGIRSVRQDAAALNVCPYDGMTPLAGDVNRDGAVTAADAVCLMRYLAEEMQEPAVSNTGAINADTDKNGLLDLQDAVNILRSLL